MGRDIDVVLQSTSDALFPAMLGKARVQLDSTDADGDTPLHVLIRRGDTEGALLLVQHGAPINAIGDMGETPLHAAIAKSNDAVVSALLAKGARTDIVSEFGETAKQKALKVGVRLTVRRS